MARRQSRIGARREGVKTFAARGKDAREKNAREKSVREKNVREKSARRENTYGASRRGGKSGSGGVGNARGGRSEFVSGRVSPMAPSHPSAAYIAALEALPPLEGGLPLPELLVPCGSEEIMHVAVQSGADAVYLGGRMHNARMNAHNFDDEAMRRAVKYCHKHGVRVYVTLNTLLYDRELEETARYAAFLQECGVDALIVADPGLCRLLHAALPDMELHASTQMAVHETGAARLLGEYGFSRVVPARELSLGDIYTMCSESGVEVEVFVHGALCVCRSGQCLFSSLVGGRSGNRGECAQPCRLPYNGGYPLSLRDLCLGGHMTELIRAGITSLKIEGRMKSPTYIHTVTSIYRRLLDERRNATSDELCELRDAFSRSGFTDGYYVDGLDDGMLGIRSESDKAATAQLRYGAKNGTNVGSVGNAGNGGNVGNIGSVESIGDADNIGNIGQVGDGGRRVIIPAQRRTLPLHEVLEHQLSEAAERLSDRMSAGHAHDGSAAQPRRTARFSSPEQITALAREYFDSAALPLDRYLASDVVGRERADTVILPTAVHDSERAAVRAELVRARKLGCRSCLVQGIGQLPLVRGLGFELVGDFRFGVTNSLTPLFISDIAALAGACDTTVADGAVINCVNTVDAAADGASMNSATTVDASADDANVSDTDGAAVTDATDAGCLDMSEILLSPELTLPRIRDIRAPHAVIVYGRVPLMLLEHRTGVHSLTDRRGVVFPVRTEQRLGGCRERELIYNSVPVYMADRAEQLARAGITTQHFIFSTESAREVDSVIAAYRDGLPPRGDAVRRIK